jgi:TRAP-type C4-dicarboxylate transport system permease small subunit
MRTLDRLVEFALAVGMAACSLAILAQVFLRYVLGAPISWAEEFAVLVFAWLIFLGAAYVQRDDSHLAIDMLRRAAGPRLALALDVLRLGLIAGCSLVIIWQGIALSLRTLPLEYPAMGVSRAWLYGAAPACFAVGLVYVIAALRARLRRTD